MKKLSTLIEITVASGNSITKLDPSQTKYNLSIDGLVAISPVLCDEFGDGANIVLYYDRLHNNVLSVRFPRYDEAFKAHPLIVDGWHKLHGVTEHGTVDSKSVSANQERLG